MPIAHSGNQIQAIERHRTRDLRQDVAGDPLDVLLALRIAKQVKELVATRAAHGVFVPGELEQPTGDLLEHEIAGSMAVVVIDAFEAVQVEEHHRQGPVIAFGEQIGLSQPIIKQVAIRKPRCGVMQSKRFGSSFLFLRIGQG